MEFRKIACESRKQAKGRLASLDGVSVLNSVGRGPSTTRAAFYRLLLPLSLLPLPLSRLYFLQLPARSTVTGLDADASDRGQIQVRFLNHKFDYRESSDSLHQFHPYFLQMSQS